MSKTFFKKRTPKEPEELLKNKLYRKRKKEEKEKARKEEEKWLKLQGYSSDDFNP